MCASCRWWQKEFNILLLALCTSHSSSHTMGFRSLQVTLQVSGHTSGLHTFRAQVTLRISGHSRSNYRTIHFQGSSHTAGFRSLQVTPGSVLHSLCKVPIYSRRVQDPPCTSCTGFLKFKSHRCSAIKKLNCFQIAA